tara:strand:- start:278 stop:763 length:486 start_codon:yes stop_codon:yes gene_type:complete
MANLVWNPASRAPNAPTLFEGEYVGAPAVVYEGRIPVSGDTCVITPAFLNAGLVLRFPDAVDGAGNSTLRAVLVRVEAFTKTNTNWMIASLNGTPIEPGTPVIPGGVPTLADDLKRVDADRAVAVYQLSNNAIGEPQWDSLSLLSTGANQAFTMSFWVAVA